MSAMITTTEFTVRRRAAAAPGRFLPGVANALWGVAYAVSVANRMSF
jgi:hypothetical protein